MPTIRNQQLTVTVLSGFLGAGKTTLLNHLIRHAAGEKIAVIVNDIGEVNIDAELINSEVRQLEGEVDQVVELSGGCICCSIQGDLSKAIFELCENPNVDHVIIESTGIAEPMSIVQTFYMPNAAGETLEDKARIDSLVTVVDAAAFIKEWKTHNAKGTDRELLRQEDERPIFELIIEQIECSDILVLNKLDLIDESEKAEIEAILRNLNDYAQLLETEYGQVEKTDVLHANRFDSKRTLSGASWLRQIETTDEEPRSYQTLRKIDLPSSSLIQPKLADPVAPANNIHNVVTLVYRARRPFRAKAFNEVINRSIPGLLRAKGYCWIKGQRDMVGFLSIAGTTTRCDFVGNWWAAALESGRIDRSQLPPEVERKWQSPHGDRRQEIVFIGYNLDRNALQVELDTCLTEV
ncbi:MAG: GTP-binding protein [Verrucomicrobiota bacterium]